MKCPHGHHEIKLGWEIQNPKEFPYDIRCGMGLARYGDEVQQILAEKKERKRKLRSKFVIGVVIASSLFIFGLITGSVRGTIALSFIGLILGLVIHADVKRNQQIKEKRKENVEQILNQFAQNLPGPPIKLIHTPKEVVEQKTEELVEETTEKLLKFV